MLIDSIAIVIACLIVLSLISYRTRALDRKGIILANIFGLGAFALGEQAAGITGLQAFATIVALFILGEIATRAGRTHKKKHPSRTIGNIVGNSGSALIFLALLQPAGFFASISSALADTLSSEIGMTSKKKPVLITTLREVPKGTDGAVSARGTLFSLAGAAAIAGMAFLFTQSQGTAGAVFIAGAIGSTIDSFLGAAFERKGKMNNTLVNFFSCLAAGAIAIAAMSAF